MEISKIIGDIYIMEQITFTEIRSKLPDINKRANAHGERFVLIRHKNEEMVALSVNDFENLVQNTEVNYVKKPISFTAIRSKMKEVNQEMKQSENTVFVVRRHKDDSLVFISNTAYKTLVNTPTEDLTLPLEAVRTSDLIAEAVQV